jgi:hypothetical protein
MKVKTKGERCGRRKPVRWPTEELWDADPKCRHKVVDAPGGGVRCVKCQGWFCF